MKYEQKPLVNKELTEKDAIDFLEQRGYSITKIKRESGRITNAELVDLFREKLKEVVGEEEILSICIDDSKEIEAIRKFRRKAEKLNITEKNANSYLERSIVLVFKYLKDLELEGPPTSLQFLLSKHGSWILQKTLQIHKIKMKEAELIYKEKIYNEEDEKFLKMREEIHKRILSGGNDNG